MKLPTRLTTVILSITAALAATIITTGSAEAAPCDPRFQPSGEIGAKWLQMKGPSGVLGCPIGPEHGLVPQQAFRGREQFFQNGHVVTSPNQGRHMVVVAYRKNNRAYVKWGTTAPFNYDLFQVRWGRTPRADWVWPNNQHEVMNGAGTRQEGGFELGRPTEPIAKDGHTATFSFTVQGCDRSIGGTTCRQGWTYPVHVRV